MPRWTRTYIRVVDRLNYKVGRFAMYLLFVLMAILLWSSVSKFGGQPSLWTLEMAQFTMVAYYILGGPYSMQMGAHVRMDLFYAKQSPVTRAWWDGFTALAVLFYLGVLIWGAAESLGYSLGLGWGEPGALGIAWPEIGRLERGPTAWRPYLWPIKMILVVGFVLMFLQAVSALIRDIAIIRRVDI